MYRVPNQKTDRNWGPKLDEEHSSKKHESMMSIPSSQVHRFLVISPSS